VWLEGLGILKKIHSPHRVSNRDLKACSIVPLPLRYPILNCLFVLSFVDAADTSATGCRINLSA
jgi:hypothetical protein